MQPDPKLVDELRERIVSIAHPLRIVLFGSAARGEMTPDSDLDVLVVVPNGVHRRRTAKDIYRGMIGLGAAADVVVVTEGDVQQYGHSAAMVVGPALKEGRDIYAAPAT